MVRKETTATDKDCDEQQLRIVQTAVAALSEDIRLKVNYSTSYTRSKEFFKGTSSDDLKFLIEFLQH